MPPKTRTGRREPSELPKSEWPRAGAWLGQAIHDARLTKRAVLTHLGYVGGTNRLNSWVDGKRRPTTKTLRRICEKTGIPYLEAVRQFGYYREYIKALDDLVSLGELWLDEDDAYGMPDADSRVASLHFGGLLYWRGALLDEATLQNAEFLTRYTVGSYSEQERQVERVELTPIEAVPGQTTQLAINPSNIARRSTVIAPAETVRTVAPKPIALAVTLAALLFPRRGEVYKDETLPYLQALLPRCDSMIEEAARARVESRKVGRPKSLHPLLERTLDVLTDANVDFLHRRIIAAEYVVSWADSLCVPFTEYVRLAGFAYWGEAGSSISTVTPYVFRPQDRLAELPAAENVTM